MTKTPTYPSGVRSADPCQINLDNYYGKVNYSPNGKFPAAMWHAGC